MKKSLIACGVSVLLGALVAWAGSWKNDLLAGMPLFALAVTAAFVIQVLVFIPSNAAKTEKFFDLTGSGTFALISLGLLAAAQDRDLRSVLLTAMVVLWAVRLGSFLFVRIRKAGKDDRFDALKTNPIIFLRVWMIQGLWVSVTAAAAWIAVASEREVPMGLASWFGVAVWGCGLLIESLADSQKSAFRAVPENAGRFISSGLWSTSRHPNYLGEILVWVGVACVAAPVLQGWQYIGLLSPVFVVMLLTRVSGIPLLEAKADRNWGGQPEYEAYKASTPVLLPRLGVWPRR